MLTGLHFVPHPDAVYDFDYSSIVDEANILLVEEPERARYFIRHWCQESLFFLLYFILRVPVNHPYLVDRIVEVQNDNNYTLDLWAREFFKSTIITYGLNIQTILTDPNSRIGIFSHTRKIAKDFLRRIKLTFETNEILKALYPDILYQNPTSQAPKWSEDDGIIVNRPTVFQESTVEAWGLTDGQPTSKHFSVLNYDDIVTIDSVRTADQLKKTDDCFKMSDNLGTKDGIRRVIGTIYHFNDQHCKLMDDGVFKARVRPAEDPETGRPVFLSADELAHKRRKLGPYAYNTQMLLNPVAKEDQRFLYEWLRFYRPPLPDPISLYLLCDPANEKKKKQAGHDYTVYWLWGIDSRGNHFLVDCVRDRLTLPERWRALKDMVRKWPKIQAIGYEQYGMAADIQHYEEMMKQEGFYFNIVELSGTKLSKEDRILRMLPTFEQRKVYLPEYLEYRDKEGKVIDLVHAFIHEEYLDFPFSKHDDMLDAASRIEDKVLDACEPYDDWAGEEDSLIEDVWGIHRVDVDEPLGQDPWSGY